MSQICLARVTYGSHLFGTNNEKSDLDIKSVMVPSVREILLGEVNWSRAIDADYSRANTADDVDDERHDLLRFMHLLAAGQPMALEMLFAPDHLHLVDPDPI